MKVAYRAAEQHTVALNEVTTPSAFTLLKPKELVCHQEEKSGKNGWPTAKRKVNGMEIPQAMLLDWAKRIDSHGMMLNTHEVSKVCREIRTYASSNENERSTLRILFYNRDES